MVEKYSRNPNTNCSICNKPIYKRPSTINLNKGKVYCSQKCYGISCHKEIPCSVCKKPILSGLNKKTCCRSCANKLRIGIKYKLNRPRDIVKTYLQLKTRLLTQRSNKCEKCGYDKTEILEIHHKDRDRNNNKLDNLILICPNCHSEEHHFKKLGKIHQ